MSNAISTIQTEKRVLMERSEVPRNVQSNADYDLNNCDSQSSKEELENIVKLSENCSVASFSFLENNYNNNNKG